MSSITHALLPPVGEYITRHIWPNPPPAALTTCDHPCSLTRADFWLGAMQIIHTSKWIDSEMGYPESNSGGGEYVRLIIAVNWKGEYPFLAWTWRSRVCLTTFEKRMLWTDTLKDRLEENKFVLYRERSSNSGGHL